VAHPSTPSHPIYQSAQEAQAHTDTFYRSGGFEYTPAQVQRWLQVLFTTPPKGRVLDLCCGDGIWSQGLTQWAPNAELHGIDISQGAIDAAQSKLDQGNASRFIVADTEQPLPWDDGFFDTILARGPGLYNQHNMDRPAAIAVIQDWHRTLKPNGTMYSVFASDPARFGTYTNPLLVKLPYNRAPRLTDAVDFTGGKYHHTTTSFMAPFLKATGVEIKDYKFLRKNHILQTRRTT